MRLRTAVFGIAAIALAGCAVWATWVKPRFVASRQVVNWANMQVYVGFLEEYRQAHGRFPVTLPEAVPTEHSQRERWLTAHDVYDHSLFYESDGTRYLLASFGRDGIRDREGYSRNETIERIDDAPCDDADVDTTYSSDGIRQLCGK
ncbi:MAG TPA: hypothetical protein VD738_04430 [Nitrospira sp.]|nr:hypothetical protein [Nitrospira sp.]